MSLSVKFKSFCEEKLLEVRQIRGEGLQLGEDQGTIFPKRDIATAESLQHILLGGALLKFRHDV